MAKTLGLLRLSLPLIKIFQTRDAIPIHLYQRTKKGKDASFLSIWERFLNDYFHKR